MIPLLPFQFLPKIAINKHPQYPQKLMNKRWGSEIVYNFVELIWLSTATQKDNIQGIFNTDEQLACGRYCLNTKFALYDKKNTQTCKNGPLYCL